jgi:hypothetical protein
VYWPRQGWPEPPGSLFCAVFKRPKFCSRKTNENESFFDSPERWTSWCPTIGQPLPVPNTLSLITSHLRPGVGSRVIHFSPRPEHPFPDHLTLTSVSWSTIHSFQSSLAEMAFTSLPLQTSSRFRSAEMRATASEASIIMAGRTRPRGVVRNASSKQNEAIASSMMISMIFFTEHESKHLFSPEGVPGNHARKVHLLCNDASASKWRRKSLLSRRSSTKKKSKYSCISLLDHHRALQPAVEIKWLTQEIVDDRGLPDA